jgi:hypothetical protein
VFTYLQCSHVGNVNILALFTYLQCSHIDFVLILAIFTYLQNSHIYNVHIFTEKEESGDVEASSSKEDVPVSSSTDRQTDACK